MVTRIRIWLKQNKIFFEIFSSVLISGTALFVSIAAYNVNKQQLLTSELAALPHISVEKRLIRDEMSGKFDHDELVVSNYGSPIYNTNIKVRTFLKVKTYDLKSKEFFIPIIHYYHAQYTSGEPTGVLSTFKLAGNNATFGRLYDEALTEAREKGHFIEVEIARIVTVQFNDRLNRPNTEYFFDTSHVSRESVQNLIKSWDQSPPENLDTLNLEKVLQRIMSNEG